jgi:hypothetical protein
MYPVYQIIPTSLSQFRGAIPADLNTPEYQSIPDDLREKIPEIPDKNFHRENFRTITKK